jgi:hypothetical protein
MVNSKGLKGVRERLDVVLAKAHTSDRVRTARKGVRESLDVVLTKAHTIHTGRPER